VLTRLRVLLKPLFRRHRFEEDLAEELRFHVSTYADDLERSGIPRAEAVRRARLEFGGVESVREDCREARGLRLLDELRQDVRYAVRVMARTPGFTAAAILSLALGIGANTAIFSVMDAVLLRMLPVEHPEQLHFLAHGTGDNPGLSSTYPLFERYRRDLDVFSGITAYNIQEFKVSSAEGSDLVNGQFVAGNFHSVVGVPLVLGRGFSSEPDQPNDSSYVVVITEGFWTRRLGRDPDVIGKRLAVNGKQVTVIGVTGAGFDGLRPGRPLDITLPIALKMVEDPEFAGRHDTWTGLNIVGRLKRGVEDGQAVAAVDTVFRGYMSDPAQDWVKRDGRLPDGLSIGRLMPAGKGTGALRQQYDLALRALMGMVAVFLLIAWANVANLMLARASIRVKEVAVRISVGAGRARLVRQFLTETVLLAIVGGAVGLLVSLWATTAIVTLFRAGQMPVVIEPETNVRVLAFTGAVSLLTGIVCGLVPSLKATHVDIAPTLKENSTGSAGAGRRLLPAGKVLAMCQVALCILLMAWTGLLVRTFQNLKTLDAGFQKDGVLLFYLDTRGSEAQAHTLYGGLLDRLQALPGVRAAAVSTASPLATDSEERGIRIPGLAEEARARTAVTNRITPDYLSTVGIRVLRGRGVTAQDSAAGPKVALINEALARAYFPDSDPLGMTFSFMSAPNDPVTIVGIVQDTRHRNLREPAPRMAYVTLAQAEEPPGLLTAVVRTAQDPRSHEAAVRDAVRRVSPDLVISYVRTLEEQVDASLVRERVLAALSTGFGVLALVLACVGLYGVISYGVTRRAREIGIRIALGAQRAALQWQVIRETLTVSAAGIMIGLIAALVTTNLVSAFLFGLSPRDPFTLVASVLVLLATSLVAAYLPARRAAAIDPIRVLKTE
jgi:putative ABC transport system permease protein